MIHGINFKKDDCFEEVKRSLIRLMGNSRKVNKNYSNTYAIKEVKGIIVDSMAGTSTQQRKKSNRRTQGNGTRAERQETEERNPSTNRVRMETDSGVKYASVIGT